MRGRLVLLLYLSALPIRFEKTCSISTGSADAVGRLPICQSTRDREAPPGAVDHASRDGLHVDPLLDDLLAAEAREAQQFVDQHVHPRVGREDPLEELAGGRVPLGRELLFEDAGVVVGDAQRRAKVVGDRVRERLELLVGGGEFGGTRLDPSFEVGVEAPHLVLGGAALGVLAAGLAQAAVEPLGHHFDRDGLHDQHHDDREQVGDVGEVAKLRRGAYPSSPATRRA